jgi:histidinol-phosphatase (PHP family)
LNLADLHTHSDNSPDGENSVIELCEKAVAADLSTIAITDHCEIDLYQKDRYETILRQSYFDILKARDIFDGQIEVLKGIELGNALSDRVLAERVVANRPYDFILGSLHHPTGFDDFAFTDFNLVDVHKLLELYFEELEALTVWGKFDVLAHLTYPMRYINGAYNLGVDIQDYAENIKRVYAKLIQNGKGIEINTSGLRQPYGETMPDFLSIRLFREMGGSILTIGSDAHAAKDVGANLEDALRLARMAGFENYCIFRQREPVFIKIEV